MADQSKRAVLMEGSFYLARCIERWASVVYLLNDDELTTLTAERMDKIANQIDEGIEAIAKATGIEIPPPHMAKPVFPNMN